jgi:hypothetical protein
MWYIDDVQVIWRITGILRVKSLFSKTQHDTKTTKKPRQKNNQNDEKSQNEEKKRRRFLG